MTAKPLLPQQPVTAKGDAPSRDLVEVVQRIVAEILATEARTDALESVAISSAPGSAPRYACRAWVNFNGTGTVAIRASGNVSSITDNGVGDYTVNFTTAMPDADYAVAMTCTNEFNVQHGVGFITTQTASSVRVIFHSPANSANTVDKSIVNVAIFR